MSAEVARSLRAHPFLRGLDPEQVDKIAQHGEVIEVAAGTLLAREGDIAEHFYLILAGRFAIETNVPERVPITLQTVDEGEVIGWSWVDANPWLFDIRALADSSCVALRAKDIVGLLNEDKELGLQIMRRLNRVMTERLRATRLQLLDLFGKGRAS
jgi:CRP-like cAMP-binding protein